MQNFINAPHRGASPAVPGPATSAAPNAALLIDFDNVTMGIRSDLTRQLKELLNSDIIRGKVAVQRAYADWRRYAQYIVPLSEASVDLIFAPAYGSSKKNATDIRLAIDALELVFTRPEIGVYILLSGDSDFSSLVLKLKEYGKYVIGVGLRESASDLLVQNCDEYFSYSSLTGLTKAGEEDTIGAIDPWDLVERSVNRMAEENDVMRSDRLKQVMLDLDPNFDEGEIGYSKFNKFLAEAASRSKLALKKLGNGQYEVQPIARGEAPPKQEEKRRPRREEPRRKRPEPQPRADRPEPKREPRAERPEKELQPQPRAEQEPRREAPAPRPKPEPQPRERRAEDLKHGYELLTRAIRELIEKPGDAARDSDIKRKMLELESGWDESELGFTKFSRFLRQAHDAEVVDLRRTAEGYYEAQLPSGVGSSGPKREHRPTAQAPAPKPRAEEKPAARAEEKPAAPAEEKPAGRAEEKPAGRAEEKPAARVEAKVEVKPEPKEEAKAAAEAKEKEEAKSAEAKEKEAAKAAEEKEEAKAAVEAKEKEGVAKKEVKAKEEEKKQDEARVRSYGRRGGRRGRGPEGPPPLLPGQAVWGTGGKAGAGPDAKAEPKLTAEEAATPKPEVEKGPAPKADAGKPDAGKGAAPKPEVEKAPAPKPEVEKAPAPKPEVEKVPAPEAKAAPAAGPDAQATGAREAPGVPEFDADGLGLPTEEGAVIRYLSNSYQGVGQKTAEALIEAFGADRVFNGLHTNPEKVREVLGSGRRTEILLEAWERDYRRRTTAGAADKK